MSWQDVRGWYEEQDDEPEPEDVPVAVKSCWWCGRAFFGPANEAERFCSLECDLSWCVRSAADVPPPADDEIHF